MKEEDINRLNPLIATVIIGVRKLREIKIYPLSMAGQLELSSIFVKTIQEIISSEEINNNFLFAEAIRKAINDNIGKVLTLITDEGEALLSDITNVQAVSIAELVYAMNYGVLEKKVRSLVEKIRTTFLSQPLSPASSETTLNTDSKTSLEEATKKEDSPLDK